MYCKLGLLCHPTGKMVYTVSSKYKHIYNTWIPIRNQNLCVIFVYFALKAYSVILPVGLQSSPDLQYMKVHILGSTKSNNNTFESKSDLQIWILVQNVYFIHMSWKSQDLGYHAMFGLHLILVPRVSAYNRRRHLDFTIY